MQIISKQLMRLTVKQFQCQWYSSIIEKLICLVYGFHFDISQENIKDNSQSFLSENQLKL